MNEKLTKRLGVVQLNTVQLETYEEAQRLEGKNKSDWGRDTLDTQAKLTIDKHKGK